MFCSNCGHKIDNGSFCSNCGSPTGRFQDRLKNNKKLFILIAAVIAVGAMVALVVVLPGLKGSQSDPNVVAEDFLAAMARGDYDATIRLLEAESLKQMAATFDASLEELKNSLALSIKDDGLSAGESYEVVSVEVNNNVAAVSADFTEYDGTRYPIPFKLSQIRGKWFVDPNILRDQVIAQDHAISKIINNACLGLELDASLSGQDRPVLTWEKLKDFLSDDYIQYVESIKGEKLSGATITESLCDGGWIKLTTGWITMQDSIHGLSITYTESDPN